jgi:hypothetical protein
MENLVHWCPASMMASTKAAGGLRTVSFNHKKHMQGSYVGCMILPLTVTATAQSWQTSLYESFVQADIWTSSF